MIRRTILRAGATLAAAPIARAIAAPVPPAQSPVEGVPPWTKEQGTPIADDHYGAPSPFESHVVRRPRDKLLFDTSGSIFTPLQH
ncbi:MAG: sulfite dehydrogenase, partial [Janthinobacterium lividum]